VTKSESPGRKNPISSPVSEKMIAIRTGYPPQVRRLSRSRRREKNSRRRSTTGE
jgi:hypothetical protein